MASATSALCVLTLCLGPLLACGEQTAGECRIGADCPSGSCGEDGQCNTDPDADAGPDAGDQGPDAALSACGTTIDAFISRDELPMKAGLKADFRIASNASFDTAGTSDSSGRSWDLDRPLANDVDTEVELFSIAGSWYAESYPTASYAAQLSQSSELLGVFDLRDEGLYLLGVVSPDPGVTRTELSYDPAVLLMPLPLSEGGSWETDSSISGVASGVVSFYSERYAGSADASGSLTTPFGNFRVLRTRMDLTRTVGLLVTTTRQYSFVSECAGIVASIASEENEESVEFTSAAEIRRVLP